MQALSFEVETYLQRKLSYVAYYMYKNLAKELSRRSVKTITLSDIELLNVSRIHNMYFTQKAVSELRSHRLIVCAVSGDNDGRTTYSLRTPVLWREDVPKQRYFYFPKKDIA